MKYIQLKSFFLLTLLLSSVACKKKLNDLYQNPDGYSKEMADKSGVSVIAGFFTSQLTQGFFLSGDYGSVYHQVRSGGRVTGSAVQIYNTMTEGGGNTLADVEHDWGTGGFNESIFNFVNTQWITPILWAQREYNNTPQAKRTNLDSLYITLMHVLKGYAYQRATDMYDKIPYIETGSAGGLDGVKAKYIGQSEIYQKIIGDLKAADEVLTTLTLSSTEQASFSQQDIIFGGNILKWRKYINSLRLRCAITVSEVLPDLTKKVITELQGKPLLTEYNDVAGVADIAVIALNRICNELGITRAYRERGGDFRAGKKFLQDVMNCQPTLGSKVVNGKTLYYFSGDNSATGLLDGTVDPRVSYIFATDLKGRYLGAETQWDGNTDPNSYLNKVLRGIYINDPILTDISKTTITFGANNKLSITLDAESKADLSKREAFLLNSLRLILAATDDNEGQLGSENNLVAEYNVRPEFNFALKYPTIHAVETELSLAEAAVRGWGQLNGSARDHYKNAIILSCKYWYELNNSNQYSKTTMPAMPTTMSDFRINDKPAMEYNASKYAENAAEKFDAMSSTQKVQAIFDQLQLHYNMLNFEIPYTAARRLIKYLGTNPASMYSKYKWKERMTYPSSVQASDPEGWSIISPTNNPDLPVWFTGRTTKWKNALE
ncbi:SusD/RagB family nutrient-binding outer membrane lipoprotein [Chitinophaga silvatica]|uniref:SusD/RagB family nutrient-binding outer membrane lipoprotein n=1 Tax=Chitinophaga silvatica TaxID=2282649 RepID=A0A3E1YHM7_9BACT|nr:SusD/RagB family nutrient-binding outer membrane lipoprotein [Chitinophaga silvatica]RFS26899.1 SusD/RagB family nutrient-binding outer membrane lipoprotein [Chitinophaga silvatica]